MSPRRPTDRAYVLGAYVTGLGLGAMIAVSLAEYDAALIARAQSVALAGFLRRLAEQPDPEPDPEV